MPFWHHYSAIGYQLRAFAWYHKLLLASGAAVLPVFCYLLWITAGDLRGAWCSWLQACDYRLACATYQEQKSAFCARIPTLRTQAKQFQEWCACPAMASLTGALCYFAAQCAHHGVQCVRLVPIDLHRSGLLATARYTVTLHAEFAQIIAFCRALTAECRSLSVQPFRIALLDSNTVAATLVVACTVVANKESADAVPSPIFNSGTMFHSAVDQSSSSGAAEA